MSTHNIHIPNEIFILIIEQGDIDSLPNLVRSSKTLYRLGIRKLYFHLHIRTDRTIPLFLRNILITDKSLERFKELLSYVRAFTCMHPVKFDLLPYVNGSLLDRFIPRDICKLLAKKNNELNAGGHATRWWTVLSKTPSPSYRALLSPAVALLLFKLPNLQSLQLNIATEEHHHMEKPCSTWFLNEILDACYDQNKLNPGSVKIFPHLKHVALTAKSPELALKFLRLDSIENLALEFVSRVWLRGEELTQSNYHMKSIQLVGTEGNRAFNTDLFKKFDSLTDIYFEPAKTFRLDNVPFNSLNLSGLHRLEHCLEKLVLRNNEQNAPTALNGQPMSFSNFKVLKYLDIPASTFLGDHPETAKKCKEAHSVCPLASNLTSSLPQSLEHLILRYKGDNASIACSLLPLLQEKEIYVPELNNLDIYRISKPHGGYVYRTGGNISNMRILSVVCAENGINFCQQELLPPYEEGLATLKSKRPFRPRRRMGWHKGSWDEFGSLT